MKELEKLTFWQQCRFKGLYAICYLVSLQPLWMLYIFSDFLYFLVFYIVRYRRSIVHKNLLTSFPEKNEDELIDITHEFYHWFCDYLVETIKLTTISKEELCRRMRFENVELPIRLLQEDKPVMLLLGHYCNWEWVSSIPQHINLPETAWMPMQIYHPLENPVVNHLFLRIRGRMGVQSISMNDTLRALVHARQDGTPPMCGFIADQTPNWLNIHCWTPFLNHPYTPFFIGCERIAKKIKGSVVYLDLRRERRGYYVARYELMTETPYEYPDYEITQWYAQKLEQTINRQPAFWLWTHNRWKRTREEFYQRKGMDVPDEEPSATHS